MDEQESSIPVPLGAWLYLTLIHGVLGFVVFTRLLVGGARFQRFAEEWQLYVPPTTAAFVDLSVWMGDHLFLVVAVAAVVLVIDGLILWLLGGWQRSEGQLWFFLVVGVLLITWGMMEVSLFLQYYKLQRALSR
jgi:hypothetical protein